MYRLECIAGVDEVGRGPLAGAVYAAAVILDPTNPVAGLADSKKLTEKKRVHLDVEIRARALSYAIGIASVAEIDEINILQASLLAMRRAVDSLSGRIDLVLVDGNRTPDLLQPAAWLIKGDSRFDAIKAASIIAKVARDTEMKRLDAIYPGYGLARHKGYPTAEHMSAIASLGPSNIHRMSFAPCRKAAGLD